MMRPVASAADWDDLLIRVGRRAPGEPAPHVLQSWAWGEIKGRWGWTVERWSWGEPGAEFAAAQVLRRPIGRLPLAVAYAPKGPLVAADADTIADRWSAVLGDLETWARRKRVAVLKIDPDVAAGRADVASIWRGRGWRPSPQQIQFRNTMRSPLPADDPDERLMAAYKAKTRYNVRLAERRGVVVRAGGSADLGAFYDLYATTAGRQGFAIRARDYYMDVWSTFLGAGAAAVLLAERGGRPLAGAIPIRFGRTAWYLYGASADDDRGDMAPYAAMHACLRWAAEHGCETFDWWGGPTTADPGDPLAGVGRFKEGFGARWAPQLGAYDFAVSPALTRVYAAAGAARHAWLRRSARRRR